MKRLSLLALVVTALSWSTIQQATVARIQNTLPYEVEIFTQTRKCGQYGWGAQREKIAPGQWLDLCSGTEISAELILPESKRNDRQNLPVFVEKGRPVFSYDIKVPQHQDWVLYIVPASSGALDGIRGEGYITEDFINNKTKVKVRI